MPNLPSTLYALQTLEIDVDNSRARLEAIEKLLASNEQVQNAEAALQASELHLQQSHAHLKNLELEISGLRQKINEVEELLYSGQLKNPRELQERQAESEALKKRLTTLEYDSLEANHVFENAKQQKEADDKIMAAALAEHDKSSSSLSAERDKLNEHVRAKLKERKALMAHVPDDTYQHYRQLRKKKKGVAVALLDGNSCSACHIEQTWVLTQQVKNDEGIVYCCECGRILARQ